jgi:hypothetical protein
VFGGTKGSAFFFRINRLHRFAYFHDSYPSELNTDTVALKAKEEIEERLVRFTDLQAGAAFGGGQFFREFGSHLRKKLQIAF